MGNLNKGAKSTKKEVIVNEVVTTLDVTNENKTKLSLADYTELSKKKEKLNFDKHKVNLASPLKLFKWILENDKELTKESKEKIKVSLENVASKQKYYESKTGNKMNVFEFFGWLTPSEAIEYALSGTNYKQFNSCVYRVEKDLYFFHKETIEIKEMKASKLSEMPRIFMNEVKGEISIHNQLMDVTNVFEIGKKSKYGASIIGKLFNQSPLTLLSLIEAEKIEIETITNFLESKVKTCVNGSRKMELTNFQYQFFMFFISEETAKDLSLINIEFVQNDMLNAQSLFNIEYIFKSEIEAEKKIISDILPNLKNFKGETLVKNLSLIGEAINNLNSYLKPEIFNTLESVQSELTTIKSDVLRYESIEEINKSDKEKLEMLKTKAENLEYLLNTCEVLESFKTFEPLTIENFVSSEILAKVESKELTVA